jgi:hypothetical protein
VGPHRTPGHGRRVPIPYTRPQKPHRKGGSHNQYSLGGIKEPKERHKGQSSETIATKHEGQAGQSPKTIAEALSDSNRGQEIGKGGFGVVYDLPRGFNKQRAVLKVIDMTKLSYAKSKKGQRISYATVQAEVQRLVLVQQLLAWGYDCDRREGGVYYIVMRNMGKRGDKFDAGLTMTEQLRFLKPTVKQYQEKYGLIHK